MLTIVLKEVFMDEEKSEVSLRCPDCRNDLYISSHKTGDRRPETLASFGRCECSNHSGCGSLWNVTATAEDGNKVRFIFVRVQA